MNTAVEMLPTYEDTFDQIVADFGNGPTIVETVAVATRGLGNAVFDRTSAGAAVLQEQVAAGITEHNVGLAAFQSSV